MLIHVNIVSERGVVFLRNQDVTTKELLALGEKLSTLTGSVSIPSSHHSQMDLSDKYLSQSRSRQGFTFIPSLKRAVSLVIRSASSVV
jgi:hypothetical protein